MRRVVKPRCRHECRFLEVTPSLWLCPHAAYGEASYLRGAVSDARAMLERAGGYEAVLTRVVAEEDKAKQAKKDERESRRHRPPASEQVRYG